MSAVSEKTVLYYFPLEGRGEQVRLALVEAEIPYEVRDIHIHPFGADEVVSK